MEGKGGKWGKCGRKGWESIIEGKRWEMWGEGVGKASLMGKVGNVDGKGGIGLKTGDNKIYKDRRLEEK